MGFNEIPVLNGGFAPVDSELTVELTDIEGEIPKDLTGMYVRNGPNRRFEAPGRYHWFDGDGMLHAVRFEQGRAVYQNRWVMTDSLQEELKAGGALWQGIKDPPRKDRPDMPIKNTSTSSFMQETWSQCGTWVARFTSVGPTTCQPSENWNLTHVCRDCQSRHIPR